MGKRGPKKEPVELKVVKGTDRPSRDGKPIVQTYGIPANPFDADDSKPEHKAWEDVIAGMKKAGTHIALAHSDFAALEAAAIALARARQASELVAQLAPHERWIETRSNGLMQHPFLREEKAAWKEWRAFGADLGMSPSSRSNVSTPTTASGQQNADDPLMQRLLKIAPTKVE